MENEVLNQEQQEVEVNFFDDENDFAEFEEVDQQESNEATDEEATEETQETESKEQPQLVPLKYNGESKEMPLDEVITLAQKGMNYDKVAAERDSLRNSTEIKLLRDLAQQNGLSVNDLLKNLQEANDNQHKARIFNEFKVKYPEATDELLTQLTESEFGKRTEQRKVELQEIATKEAKSKQQQQITSFLEKFPTLDPKDVITDEIMTLVKSGATLIEAYQEKQLEAMQVQIAELQKQLEAHKQNEKNRKGTSKPLQSVGADVTDAFLLEFGKD